MNELQIFKNKDFGQIRGAIINGEAWFVGKEVAKALGYTDLNHSITDHVDEDDRINSKTHGQNAPEFGQRGTWLINESGLYSLIMSSKLTNAKKFKRWVTSEVLPSIRKHGVYMTNNTIDKIINDPDFGIKLLTELKEERDKRKALEIKTEVQQKEITEMKPKANYHDNVLNKADLITATVIAKDLGLSSAAKLNEILHKNKIIFKTQRGIWCPYAEYKWLIEKEYCDYKSYEDKHSIPCLKWTERGRKWILDNYDKWMKKCA